MLRTDIPTYLNYADNHIYITSDQPGYAGGETAVCDNTCGGCSGTALDCTSCKCDSYLYDPNKGTTYNRCITIASLPTSGYYVASTTSTLGDGTAYPCSSPCLHCSGSASSCASCVSGYYRYDPSGGTNYNGCLLIGQLNNLQSNRRGSYVLANTATDGTGIAYSCSAPCGTCSNSASNCDTYTVVCVNNEYLYDASGGTDYTECVSGNNLDALRSNGRGTYIVPGTRSDGLGQAFSCHPRCVTCKDTATRCTSCPNKRPVFPRPEL